MSFKAALDGKVLKGQFTGNTGTTLTLAIPAKIGRFDANTAVVSVSVLDASDDSTAWSYRISSFSSSQLVLEFGTALAAGDRVHVSIMD